MAQAIIRMAVDTLSNVPDGESRNDGVSGLRVVVTSIGVGNVTHQMRLVNSTQNPAPTLSQNTSTEWQFTPTTATAGHAYVVELLVTDGAGGTDLVRRVYRIPTLNLGLLIPAPMETADSAASLFNLGAAVIKASNDNAGGNYLGWQPRLEPWYRQIDTMSRLMAIPDNTALAYRFAEGSNNYLIFETTNSNEGLVVGNIPVRGANAVGTNVAGSNITIAGGKNTGTAAGGDVLVQTAHTTGSSGATPGTLADRVRVLGNNGGVGNAQDTCVRLGQVGLTTQHDTRLQLFGHDTVNDELRWTVLTDGVNEALSCFAEKSVSGGAFADVATDRFRVGRPGITASSTVQLLLSAGTGAVNAQGALLYVGATDSLTWVHASGLLFVVALDEVRVVDRFIELSERADPTAPGTDRARFYAKDNGAGKTQLVVRFPTGAVQVIATEP